MRSTAIGHHMGLVALCTPSSCRVATGLKNTPQAQVKREVQDFVAEVLKPLYAARAISKEGYKHVMAKAVGNVVTHSSLTPGEPFMSSKRRRKIRDLVDKYVKRFEAEGGADP